MSAVLFPEEHVWGPDLRGHQTYYVLSFFAGTGSLEEGEGPFRVDSPGFPSGSPMFNLLSKTLLGPCVRLSTSLSVQFPESFVVWAISNPRPTPWKWGFEVTCGSGWIRPTPWCRGVETHFLDGSTIHVRHRKVPVLKSIFVDASFCCP